ncbi:MAG: hypothetical protein ACM3PZ_02865 [Bacillota bacterium]
MLAQFFGSTARVKILKTFLCKPEQEFYTRQLARDLGLQVNSVRRELEILQDIGLLKVVDSIHPEEVIEEAQDKKKGKKAAIDKLSIAKSKNDKKYFMVDRDFLLFNELKSLFAKANLLSCRDFIEEMKKDSSIKRLWLSGMFTGDASSPTDLLIIGKIRKDPFVKRLKQLEIDLGREINFTMMDESEFDYRMEINDIFLHNISHSRHLKVIEPDDDNVKK